MNGMFWVLMVGITGWVTGLLIGQKGYAKALIGAATNGLDILLGIIGASVGSSLFFSPMAGPGASFSRYAISMLGSAALVTFVRLAPIKCSPSKSR